MRRTHLLRLVSDTIKETDAVAFHDKWVEAALTKIMSVGVDELGTKVSPIQTPKPFTIASEGETVSSEIGPGEDFHARWMHRVHQKVIRDVDPVLVEEVEATPVQEVPFLVRSARGFGKKQELSGNSGKYMPDALTLWYRGKSRAMNVTYKIGGRGGKQGKYDDRNSTHTYAVHSPLPTTKAPWRLPEHYKTTPIPSLHLGGIGFSPFFVTQPHNLQLLLMNDKGKGEAEAEQPAPDASNA